MNHFVSVFSFFHMGGYALFVWPAYFVVLSVLVIYLLLARYRFKFFLRRLRDHHADNT